jgi:sirohydrochlorin cobaltochelatase
VSVGLIVFAHGSSVPSANAAVEAVARSLAEAGGYRVEVGFLDPVHPTLPEAAARLVQDGVSRILILPYFLTLGLHLQRDLPRLAEAVAQAHPGVEVRMTEPLDGHAALVQILLDRARAVLSEL